jgi:outer membrane protein assembly factor BamB
MLQFIKNCRGAAVAILIAAGIYASTVAGNTDDSTSKSARTGAPQSISADAGAPIRVSRESSVTTDAKTDWPCWRGPHGNGQAAADQTPPTKWSAKENILWKSKIPGRGHSSPIVVGNQIFLTSADDKAQIQWVICYDATTGEQKWQKEIHKGGFEFKNAKASMASSTPACDGKRIYVTFVNHHAAYTTALDLNGAQLWQTKITDYEEHQGYGSSPAIYGSLLLVSADNKAGGAIAGLDRESGKIVWRVDRPKKPNYASPVVVRVADKDQLLLIGCDLVTSLDPTSGKSIWEIDGATTECVTSTMTDGKSIFTSGGYPENHVSAVSADGSGKVVWKTNARVYVPSMLLKDGHIYAALDAGVATCWDAATGKEKWKGRLGGTFSSSPVLVGDVIYATNEAGKTYLFKADPAKFQLLGSNQLGDEVFATPTIVRSRIYHRVAERVDGQRQEMLYCIGEN